MNSTPVYPAYALVAMAREANRALVHALRVNSAPLAVNAARRRAKYMTLARATRVNERIAELNARECAGKTMAWWQEFRAAVSSAAPAKARPQRPSVHGGA